MSSSCPFRAQKLSDPRNICKCTYSLSTFLCGLGLLSTRGSCRHVPPLPSSRTSVEQIQPSILLLCNGRACDTALCPPNKTNPHTLTHTTQHRNTRTHEHAHARMRCKRSPDASATPSRSLWSIGQCGLRWNWNLHGNLLQAKIRDFEPSCWVDMAWPI